MRHLFAGPFARGGRRLQSLAIIAAAAGQILTARLTAWLHLGQEIGTRSAFASHPLTPLGPAFAIWVVIYAGMLATAIWQAMPRQTYNRALDHVGWNIAAIGAINALWQIWVPLYGFDWVSSLLVATALTLGISALMRLRGNILLAKADDLMLHAPLALVTGWLSVAAVVNFTSELVAGGHGLDPRDPNVSMAFLIALAAFGAVMAWLSESLVYSAAVIWGLAWVALANIDREHEPALATMAVIGIAAVALICLLTHARRHTDGSLQARGG